MMVKHKQYHSTDNFELDYFLKHGQLFGLLLNIKRKLKVASGKKNFRFKETDIFVR